MRDIQHHLASTLSVELSAGTISKITDAVADAVARVAAPPAGRVLFPVFYHRRDPGRWSAPVHRVTSRSAHITVGAGHGRLSSTWLKYLGPGPEEGASFWAHVCARAGTTAASGRV